MTIWYALAVTLTTGVFIISGRFLIGESYIEGIDQLNDKEFEEIRPRIEKYANTGNVQAASAAIKEHTELDASLFFFQVGHSHEDVFFTSSNLGGHELPHEVHRQRRLTIVDPDLGLLRVGEYEAGDYDIHIASSLQGLQALFGNLYRLGMAGLIVVFLLSIAVGRFLSKAALRPITGIQETAALISANNLSARIETIDTGDEVSRLAALLNTMFDRLEQSFEEVKRFTADASHELKTPLSLIRLNAEQLRDRLASGDSDSMKLVQNQLGLVDNLNKVVNDLLILSKADAGALSLSKGKQKIQDFVVDFAQDAEALCEDRGLHFYLENEFDGEAWFDPLWIRHVLFNLISNAIRFSPSGGSVRLVSEISDRHWQVESRDEGPGISNEMKARVFERFFNQEDPDGGRGSGLGLPLCKSIVRLHDGEIELVNRSDKRGALARFRLPL